jgi:hypothetical protein
VDLEKRGRRCRSLERAVLVGAAAVAGALGPPGGGMAEAQVTEPNSADRLIFWTNCSQIPGLTDEKLELWNSRGVDGIACMAGRLSSMGGNQDFTGDPRATLAGANYNLQRRLRDTNIVSRMGAHGMKAYLGVWLSNYGNTATPLENWFDDRGWAENVLPKMADAAGAARLLGFAGLAFDPELYKQTGGVRSATWNWEFPRNSHSEGEVRAKASQRGRELMRTLTASFPGLELMAVGVRLPDTWRELVQAELNGRENAHARFLHIDFWDGLSSVEGYGAIRLADATFYKTPHLGTWETAFQYHYNKLYSYLSRRLSNWAYASSRLFVSPFSWINAGPNPSEEEARPPEYVATQLAAFRKWGMGGEFPNFSYGGLEGFDYKPYVSAMQAASTPEVVDAAPPALVVNSVPAGSRAPIASLGLAGTATDNLAIRVVRWANSRGGSGTAHLTWDIISGNYQSGYNWRTRWSAPAIPVKSGDNQITVTVEDIKGLATTQVIGFANGSSPSPPEHSWAGERGARERLKVGQVRYRSKYKLAHARRGVRIMVARVGTGLKVELDKRGSVKVKRRGRWYVLALKLRRKGSYTLTLTPRGGPSENRTIMFVVV